MKKRLWFIVPSVILVLLLLPLVASAAISDSQVVAILNASIADFTTGVVSLTRLAYCASGVTALC